MASLAKSALDSQGTLLYHHPASPLASLRSLFDLDPPDADQLHAWIVEGFLGNSVVHIHLLEPNLLEGTFIGQLRIQPFSRRLVETVVYVENGSYEVFIVRLTHLVAPDEFASSSLSGWESLRLVWVLLSAGSGLLASLCSWFAFADSFAVVFTSVLVTSCTPGITLPLVGCSRDVFGFFFSCLLPQLCQSLVHSLVSWLLSSFSDRCF